MSQSIEVHVYYESSGQHYWEPFNVDRIVVDVDGREVVATFKKGAFTCGELKMSSDLADVVGHLLAASTSRKTASVEASLT